MARRLKSVYGLQEATSHIWQSHWGRVLLAKGWIRGPRGIADPACMRHEPWGRRRRRRPGSSLRSWRR
eukprot:6455581-Amphidinium_carterae.1